MGEGDEDGLALKDGLKVNAGYQPVDAGVGNGGDHADDYAGDDDDYDDEDIYGNDRHGQLLVPHWRAVVRRHLLKYVIADTPRLAWLQRKMRSPFWDHYFTYMSTLGTHTFFLLGLPLFVWIGRSDMTQRLVWNLGSGVYLTGVLKDLVCVPRPFSPPLTRLTVGTHHLEYGFPSTHSANAVSIALLLWDEAERQGAPWWVGLICFIYSLSVAFGRLYCGMHTTLDVAVGTLVGYSVYHFYDKVEPYLITLLSTTTWWPPFILIPLAIFFITSHPEPIDNCPCFEDSVAFVGVQVGFAIANWTRALALSKKAMTGPVGLTSAQIVNVSPMAFLQTIGPIKMALRIIIGLAILLVWRLVAKKTFQTVLPPIFRAFFPVINLPRRHYVPANEHRHYDRRDNRSKALKTVPSILDLPSHSGLDVDQGQGQSLETSAHPGARLRKNGENGEGRNANRDDERKDEDSTQGNNERQNTQHPVPNITLSAHDQALKSTLKEGHRPSTPMSTQAILSKPRPPIHFDIDVLTKLFVYSGVGWWAADGTMRVFERIGLV